MTEDELKQWILRQLGAPAIKVDLCVEHLIDSLNEAVHWFSAKKGLKKLAFMAIHSGQVEYSLDTDTTADAEDIDTVLDVIPPSLRLDLSLIFAPTLFSDEEIPYDVFAAADTMGIYSSYTQSLQYIETAKRIIGADFEWRQEDRRLFTWPLVKDSGTAIIEYKARCLTVEQLNERDHDLVKRYALAWAKMILGRIRSKYDQWPTAIGTIGMDGLTLLEESRNEIEKLEEEIALSGYPMGFMMG
jgi:hypothetical protein